jgi:hypothetical protein
MHAVAQRALYHHVGGRALELVEHTDCGMCPTPSRILQQLPRMHLPW